MTLAEALAAWRAHNVQWGLSAAETAARLAQVWKDVLGPGRSVRSLKTGDVERLARVRDDGARAGSSLLQERGYFRRFLLWARAHGQIEQDPTLTWTVRAEEPDTGYYQILSREGEEKLLAASPEWLRRFIVVALGTGLREGTIRQLRWEWISVVEGATWVGVPAGAMKKHRAHRMPLRPDVVAAMGPRGTTGLVFPALPAAPVVWRAFKRAAAQAGLDPRLKPHDLRRTFATRLLERGVPITVVMRLGAWKESSVVFQHYASQHMDEQAAAALRGQ